MKIDPQRLRQAREARAWSQEQLAEIAGVSVRTIQRIENGAGAALETRMALASALELPLDALLVAADDRPTPPPAESASRPDDPPAAASPPPPAPPAPAPEPGHVDEDRKFRKALLGLLFCLIFVLSLHFGYQFGRDLANKQNYNDCVAEGRNDCR